MNNEGLYEIAQALKPFLPERVIIKSCGSKGRAAFRCRGYVCTV